MSDEIARAWGAFSEELKQFGDYLATSPYYRGEPMRSDAFRALAKTLAACETQYIVDHNPMAPRLVRADFGFPNPDNIYLSTELLDTADYRLYGRVGTANQTFFSLYQSTPQGSGLSGARVRAENIEKKSDGSFEIWLTRERKAEYANWLPLEPGTTSMSVYQIFADWDRETKGWFGIERIDTAGQSPAVLAPGEIIARLNRVAATVRARLEYWQSLDDRVAGMAPVNQAAEAFRNSVSSLDIQFSPGIFKVNEDEALIFELRPPKEAIYWGFSVSDFWSEPLNYVDRHASLNCAQARADADGAFRLVLAHTDPGNPNWIDIAGHPEGHFTWRVTTTGKPQDKPPTKVVPLAKLRAHLPAGTPHVTPEQRREIIRRRQRHIQYRYSL